MKIDSMNYNQRKPQQSFTARNADIRLADDIIRRVNQEFPKLSPSRIYYNLSGQRQILAKQTKSMIEKSEIIKDFRKIRPNYKTQPANYIKHLLWSIKTYKLGNCGESASLAKIGLMANGIENATKVSLYGYFSPNKRVKLDHSFVIVNLAKDAVLGKPETYGNKAYVVDLWDGFVDDVAKAFKRFEAEYSGDSRMTGIKNLGIQINDFEIDKETQNLIKKVFPNLKLKRKN